MDKATADLDLTLQLQELADNRKVGEAVDYDQLVDAKVGHILDHQDLHENYAFISGHYFGESFENRDDVDSKQQFSVLSKTLTLGQLLANSTSQVFFEDGPVPEDHSSSSNQEGARTEDCDSCWVPYNPNQLITAPCGHRFCQRCVGLVFDLATRNEASFPPCCCRQPITLEIAESMLTSDHRRDFALKAIEFSTTNRTYCHDTSCAAFILPDDIDGEKATCKTCGQVTCAICKSTEHEGDCPEDPAYVSLMAAAAEAGYQACYQCKRMVELESGCFHITCRCGAEFCYLCGTRWKGCACSLFADPVAQPMAYWMPQQGPDNWVQNAFPGAPPGPYYPGPVFYNHQIPFGLPPPHPHRAHFPLGRHDQVGIQAYNRPPGPPYGCNHRTLVRIEHGHLQCFRCYHRMRDFILECRNCGFRLCDRCAQHRIR